jgi:dihydrolipoamide dehydrogenase
MYDVIVIGGGPGGYAAAIRVSQLGGKAALIEADELGGTCVNRGCIPSKIWLRAAYLKHWIERADEFGLEASLGGVNSSALVERKTGVAHGIREGMGALLQKNGVDLIRGRGVLKSPREISVDGKIHETGKIIIATGSSIAGPDITIPDEAVLTTDNFFETGELPESIVIPGNGPIEVEMASIFASMGTSTALASPGRRILPLEDEETSQRMGQALREQGVEILANAGMEAVEKSGSKFAVKLGDKTVETDRLLICRRKPNVADLGLEDAGIGLNPDGFVEVNDKLETSAPGVYAVGDVTGGWMLSHAASSMAVTAAENAMGQDKAFPVHMVPRGLWTIPEAAAVGLSEDEAEEAGYDVEVGDFPYPVNGMAMLRGQVEGGVKVVSDSKYGEILGVHIVGAGATELIGEAIMALQLECTVDELAHTIRLHPTFSECIMDAGRSAASWALYLPPK